jgi:hypothetical protein
MMKKFFTWYVLGAFAIACLLSTQASAQTRSAGYDGTLFFDDTGEVDDTVPTYSGNGDFSDTGLDLGNDGYLFANFNAQVPVTGAPETSNDRDTLPSWFDVQDYGDNGTVTSAGGHTTWATYTLPDGSETGLSGAWVNDEVGGTDSTFNLILLGADTPRKFLLHVVTDNTNNEYDSLNRVKLKTKDDPVNETLNIDIRLRDVEVNFNNDVDVYTFELNNYRNGDVVRMQTNPDSNVDFASLSGLMIDVIDPRPIPEPSSILLLGAAGLFLAGRRRRR